MYVVTGNKFLRNALPYEFAFALISDVVIPTNSADRASIVLKAGQRVMVLKSPKGIYMQLENGKIIAIRTAFKVGGAGKGSAAQQQECKPPLEKAEMNAPEYKKGALPVIILRVTVVIVQEKEISSQSETKHPVALMYHPLIHLRL
jgi:hypothetical protein